MARQTRMTNRFLADSSELKMIGRTVPVILSASPLKIGYDVTTEKPYGNVVLKSGAKLSIQKGVSGVTIKNGFECELGGELIIE